MMVLAMNAAEYGAFHVGKEVPHVQDTPVTQRLLLPTLRSRRVSRYVTALLKDKLEQKANSPSDHAA